MNDIWLWQRLTSGDGGDEASLIEGLRELARQPMRARAPFLPALVTLADSDRPEIRAAAIAGLAGCRGMRGLAAIVAALGDADPAVWTAACRALAQTGASVPARLAHGMFHRRPEVRRQLLRDGLPVAAGHLGAYLRADPESRELARSCPWPQRSLPLAVGLYEDGAIEAAELCERFAAEHPSAIADLAARRLGRSPAVVDAYLESPQGRPPGIDVLDAVAAALAAHPHRGAVSVLAGAVLGRGSDPALGRRLAVALIGGPRPPDVALELVVAIAPALIAAPAIVDRERAAVAAAGLRRYRARIARPPARLIRRLLKCPVVGAGDQLDLDLAAAIAGLRPDRRLATLAATFGDEAIAAAIARSDRAWLSVCELPRESPPRWRRWLEAVARDDAARAGELIALAASAWTRSRDRLEQVIRELDRPARAAALIALARLAEAGRVELASDRLATLVELIAARLIPSAATAVLAELIELDTGAGREIAAALARALPAKRVGAAVAEVGAGPLERFLDCIDGAARLPWDRELALARTLVSSDAAAIAAWARQVLASVDAPPPEAPPDPAAQRARALTGAQRATIAAAADSALDAALAPALEQPSLGLCETLARRPPPAAPSVAAACALLASFDPIAEVALQLDRFASWDPDFVAELDNEARCWLRCDELPPLAHAALFRWEQHNFALAAWIEQRGGLLARLHEIAQLEGDVARLILWRGLAEVAVLLRYRDRARLETQIDARVISLLIDALGSAAGRHAARILVAVFEAKLAPIPLASVRDAIADRAADADHETRQHLRRLMRLDGLPAPPSNDAPVLALRDLIAAIRASSDLDELERACRIPARRAVEEAVLRLLLLGRDGEARLARLCGELLTLPCPAPIIASVAMWTDAAALAHIRALVASAPAEVRMRVALALCARPCCPDKTELAEVAVAAAREPIGEAPSWFATEDWDALCRHVEVESLALALADSPHHRAYRPALAYLLVAEPGSTVRDALVRFLEAGSDRPIGLRRAAARNLMANWSLEIGMPILLEEYTDPNGPNVDIGSLPISGSSDRFVETVVWMALTGGPEACAESRAIDAIRDRRDDRLWAAILEHGLQSNTRQTAAHMLAGLAGRVRAAADSKRRRVAEAFAWGIKRGRELTGRLYRIHMTSSPRALGHTYLEEDRVFVSALPMLRGERNGRDVVEGLILHELGHHVYHRGRRAAEIWREAGDRQLFALLNLIADEHLERNLRALDDGFGDRLKRLGAYAFQHAAQEIGLEHLLESLGAQAAPALIASTLELAYDESAVRIARGAILAELDRRGHPLARFARALRMGLGNRSGDPLVAAALARFDRRFRHLDMEGLWQLTLEIAELFGGRVAIAEVFGGPEGITWSARDGEVFGAGLDDDDIQQEVERILDPGQRRGDGGAFKRLTINVNPDEAFDQIHRIERIGADPERHRKLAADIQRHAARLRSHLTDLGLQHVPVGARVTGRHLDRARIRALVSRGDPRILRTRRLQSQNDLFIGVAIDCSSSMQVGDNIDRAQRFGVLVAEAVRGLPGVDARFFGFTDSVLYDAGDDDRCAVAALPCGGGNNDAAALYHLAGEAERSRRRTRVLVMISDGLPTQCSVAALRGLVTALSRRGLLCAQVAVRPLEEVCFPSYVLLDAELEAAVAGFGRMVGDLARRALEVR